MDTSPKAIKSFMNEQGYELIKIVGSHHIYRHPTTKHKIPVPIHGGKDLKLGTFRGIQKIVLQNVNK